MPRQRFQLDARKVTAEGNLAGSHTFNYLASHTHPSACCIAAPIVCDARFVLRCGTIVDHYGQSLNVTLSATQPVDASLKPSD